MPITTTTPKILFELHRSLHGYAPLDPLVGPSHCLIAHSSDQAVAGLCCQIGQIGDERYGMIGYYACREKSYGIMLLQAALNYFSGLFIKQVIGPIDGSTWARYRLITSENHSSHPLELTPPFLGEPHNPSDYPNQFEQAGFKLQEKYESRLLEAPFPLRPTACLLQQRLAKRGIRLEPLASDRYEEDLSSLFELSLASFSHNPYYTPIPKSQFLHKYRQLMALIDPELILLARDESDRLAGFIFAYPDRPTPDRLIVKTIATTPSMRPLGLAIALLDAIHQKASEKGYTQIIHALMHEKNASVKLSIHLNSKPFRSYGLYGYTF